MPNPSATSFRLVITSRDVKTPVELIDSDMHGRVIEKRTVTSEQMTVFEPQRHEGTRNTKGILRVPLCFCGSKNQG